MSEQTSLMAHSKTTFSVLRPQGFLDHKPRPLYRRMPRFKPISTINDKPLADSSLTKLVKKRVKQDPDLADTLMKAIKLALYEPQIDYALCRDQFRHAIHESLDNPNPKEQRHDIVELENTVTCIIEHVATSVDDETPRQYIRKAFMCLDNFVGQIYASNEITERVLGHGRTMARLCDGMRIVGVLWITHGGWPDHKLREDMLEYQRLYPNAGFDGVMEVLWGGLIEGTGSEIDGTDDDIEGMDGYTGGMSWYAGGDG
jgi:hypothetical protein